jgi:NAD(P)-dependent dehydrogenase (short-subunit alcohol dehydrogenase family)
MALGRTAIVVGVGPGLGWALVRRFADAGLAVAMAARRTDKLERLLAETPLPAARAFACDATDKSDVERLFEQVDHDLGPPELVVFNAGTFEPGSILDIEPADFERCWRVGCLAGLLTGQAAARRMVRQGQGSILFRELGPKGVHIAHVIIDGQIASDRYQHLEAQRGPDSLLQPDAIAEMYFQLHLQSRSAWTFELDLRPWVEKF